MIRSIVDQVDELHVVENPPENNSGSAGRFRYCPKTEDVYYFTCDDDLVYPPTYVQDTIQKLQQYGEDKTVIAWHGKKLKKHPIKQYSRDVENHNCLDRVLLDVRVDIAGTGVMAFSTKTLRIFPEQFKDKNNDDVEASILIARAGLQVIVPAHDAGYFKYLDPDPATTIWNQDALQGHRLQVETVNAFKYWPTFFCPWRDKLGTKKG
jgi:hypothetical protein